MPDFAFRDIVPAVRRTEWSRVRACTWVGLAIFVVFFSPFLVEGTAVALALVALVPLALGLGLIEHFVPSVWLMVVLFIHVAGLADLVSDFNLLGKTLIAYFTGSWVDDEDENAEGDSDERQLLLARVLITLIGALPVMLFLMFGMPPTVKLFDDLDGTSSSSSSQKSSSNSGMSNGVALILLALVWKVIMVCLRLFLLFRVTKDIIIAGRIRKESRTAIELTELFLLADLLWSGIPLGVLTFLELFLYGEGFKVQTTTTTTTTALQPVLRSVSLRICVPHIWRQQGDEVQVFELIKLVAVAVDALAASYIIYFAIFGLGRFCHLEGHDDEDEPKHEHDEHPHTAERKKVTPAMTAIQAEKEPLVINHAKKMNV
jgi:hypothetical protein